MDYGCNILYFIENQKSKQNQYDDNLLSIYKCKFAVQSPQKHIIIFSQNLRWNQIKEFKLSTIICFQVLYDDVVFVADQIVKYF